MGLVVRLHFTASGWLKPLVVFSRIETLVLGTKTHRALSLYFNYVRKSESDGCRFNFSDFPIKLKLKVKLKPIVEKRDISPPGKSPDVPS